MIRIDTKGKLCPQPLIETKKALKSASVGEKIEVVCDNEIAKENIMIFLEDMKMSPDCSVDGNVYSIHFTKATSDSPNLNPSEYCDSSPKDYAIVIKSSLMGSGDKELGEILIKAYINSLPELENQPTHIVFYNSGVKLIATESGVIESLKDLENRGVSIIVCGTCVDYYELKGKVDVGMISNMYTISDIMANTGHVVYP